MGKEMKKFFVAAVLFLSLSGLVFAADPVQMQGSGDRTLDVQISQIISKDFPKMKAYATIMDEQGNLVPGIDAKILELSADNDSNKVKGAKVVPFMSTDEGINYNVIFSSNLNVGSGILNIQTQAILNFVNLMTDHDRISIYTMSDTAIAVCEERQKKDFDFSVLTTLRVTDEKNTRLYDSVANLASAVKDKKGGRKVIIVISDERDYQSRLTASQFINNIENYGIPMYTVGLHSPSTSSQVTLEDMAKITNGKYYYCPMIRELSATLEKIANYVSNSYVITFKIRRVRADNSMHVFGLGVSLRGAFGNSTKKFLAEKKRIPFWVQIAALAVLAGIFVLVILLIILSKRGKRRRLGITNRRCPDCGNRLRDDWDSCPFCMYLPELKEGKKHRHSGGGGKPKMPKKPKMPRRPHMPKKPQVPHMPNMPNMPGGPGRM